jgi:hypothetical protein
MKRTFAIVFLFAFAFSAPADCPDNPCQGNITNKEPKRLANRLAQALTYGIPMTAVGEVECSKPLYHEWQTTPNGADRNPG